MSATDLREIVGEETENAAVTWLRNPFEKLLPVNIEPWGDTIYLLPRHAYAVITVSAPDDLRTSTSIDLSDPVTIWPGGTRSNRIYRADQRLVWDDTNPSQVFPLINASASIVVALVNRLSPRHIDVLTRAIHDTHPALLEGRNDLGLLLVEHGVLSLDPDGAFLVPSDDPMPSAAELTNPSSASASRSYIPDTTMGAQTGRLEIRSEQKRTLMDVSAIEGVDEAQGVKLKGIGIASTEALLERGKTPQGRDEIAQVTGISSAQVLRWVNHADLFRIKGVAGEYAELLEAAGVDTVAELAQRDPNNLHQALSTTNTAKKLVRQLPTATQVAAWIEEAKTLPRAVN
jgi:hypothetical protein